MIKRQPQTEVQRPLNSLKIVVARDELGEKFGSCRRPLRLLIEIEYWSRLSRQTNMRKSAFIRNLRLENTSLSLAGSRSSSPFAANFLAIVAASLSCCCLQRPRGRLNN